MPQQPSALKQKRPALPRTVNTPPGWFSRIRGGLLPAATLPGPAARYCRERDLARLLPLWPHEIAEAASAAGHLKLLARLRRALRMERQRGLAGHWTYDLARHVQLLHAYRAEVQASLQWRSRPRRDG